MAELLTGHNLVFQDGSKVPADQHLNGKVTALYFSADWCGPCHRFTPILKKFYENLKSAGNNELEIVFISWDNSAEEHEKYFKDVHGKWARLEFEDKLNKELGERLEVGGIPCLQLVKPDGTVVLEDGTIDVEIAVNGITRKCDICQEEVEGSWFKCQTCPDYDLCTKCKTHLALNPEHEFEKTQQSKGSEMKSAQTWTEWMEKYNSNKNNNDKQKGEE